MLCLWETIQCPELLLTLVGIEDGQDGIYKGYLGAAVMSAAAANFYMPCHHVACTTPRQMQYNIQCLGIVRCLRTGFTKASVLSHLK